MTGPSATGAGFDPVGYVREIEEAARAGGWTLRYLSPLRQRRPPLAAARGRHRSRRAPVFISPPAFTATRSRVRWPPSPCCAGPISSPASTRRFSRSSTPTASHAERGSTPTASTSIATTAPSRSAEIASHVEILKTLGRFDAALMLHEDYEGIGAYLYELNDALPPTLGLRMIAAMGRHVPIDLRPIIEEVPANGGVLQRRGPRP